MSQFLNNIREIMRKKHYSIHTENAYVDWTRRFILFHGKRHPNEMGEIEISQFLTYLAVDQNVAASTQNQALNALVFLYKQVLKKELGDFGHERAKRPENLPTVMTRAETAQVLGLMTGRHALMAKAPLRIQPARQGVHPSEGQDRATMLPEQLNPLLRDHLKQVRMIHNRS